MITDREEPFGSSDEEIVEPFRIGPGFIAFAVLACLPAIVAIVVFFGAWMVSGDVKAAEASSAEGQTTEVAGWKSTLVGICPVH